jgi:hypothetical protein
VRLFDGVHGLLGCLLGVEVAEALREQITAVIHIGSIQAPEGLEGGAVIVVERVGMDQGSGVLSIVAVALTSALGLDDGADVVAHEFFDGHGYTSLSTAQTMALARTACSSKTACAWSARQPSGVRPDMKI